MPQHYASQFGSVLPPKSATAPPVLDNSETVALLKRWAREDATDDPAAIARRNVNWPVQGCSQRQSSSRQACLP